MFLMKNVFKSIDSYINLSLNILVRAQLYTSQAHLLSEADGGHAVLWNKQAEKHTSLIPAVLGWNKKKTQKTVTEITYNPQS